MNHDLYDAIKSGDVDRVKQLHIQGCNIHAVDMHGENFLHKAAREGSFHCLAYLVDQGVNINAADFEGFCEFPDGETRKNGLYTPLFRAAAEGHFDCVKLLVERGADIHWKSVGGFTAAYFATSSPGVECLRYLINNGSDIYINDQNEEGDTLLHCAVELGHEEHIRYLLSVGADVDIKNHKGKTPTDVAKESRKEGAVQIIEEFKLSKSENSTLEALIKGHGCSAEDFWI